MDVWGFIQTPMLGRKLSRLCGQREASEVPELQKFPTCEKVICHAMSHYYMLPFLFSALGQRLHLKYLSKRLMCLESDVPIAGF